MKGATGTSTLTRVAVVSGSCHYAADGDSAVGVACAMAAASSSIGAVCTSARR